MKFSLEGQFLDLLYWIQDHGLFPRGRDRRETYLCPLTKKLFTGRRVLKHHSPLLWIPSIKGAMSLGLRCQEEKVGGFVVVTGRAFEGAGRTEHEAMLSMFNQMRQQRAA